MGIFSRLCRNLCLSFFFNTLGIASVIPFSSNDIAAQPISVVSMISVAQVEELRKPNYFGNSVVGAIGGLGGFFVTFYATAGILQRARIGTNNFQFEAALASGYCLGMPFGTGYFIDNNPFSKDGPKGSFKDGLKASLIGVQLGVTALFIANYISKDTKYWTALVIFPAPLITGIVGYNRSIIELQAETIEDNSLIPKDPQTKIACKILNFNLR